MKFLSRKNLNLHSASFPGGLVHCPAGVVVIVPDDVTDHSLFQLLIDSGDALIIKDDVEFKNQQPVIGAPPGPTGAPVHSPEDPVNIEDNLGPPVSSEEFQKVTKPVETKK